MSYSRVPITPVSDQTVTVISPLTINQAGSTTQLVNANKLPDDRSKTLFRVKIGGNSIPQPPVSTAYTFESSIGQLGLQSFAISGTLVDNPLSPDKSLMNFTSSDFEPSTFTQAIVSQDLNKLTTGSNDTTAFLPEASAPNEPDTPRVLIFDSLKGEILGEPTLTLSTQQHATVKFVIHDPNDKFRLQIDKLADIEIEMGLVNGYRKNKFVGKVFFVGRKLPDGTMIEAIDTGYSLQRTGNDAIAAITVAAPATNSTPEALKIKSSFGGVASFYGNNDGTAGKPTANGEKFDPTQLTAAHLTLAFNTLVRVTNPQNNKSVIVRINDRGPYTGGRVLDLSVAAATEIGIISAGHATIKADVLENSSPITASSKNILTSSQSLSATFASAEGLKFAGSPDTLNKQGDIQFQQTQMAAAETDAALRGNVLVASGNTLSSVAPGEGKSSGLTLDYQNNRTAFIGHPIVYKRTNLHLQSGFGAITVQGWDVNNKQTIGATVVSPGLVQQHPTGIIQAPEWGSVKLHDPIFPECPYTWADATKNGSRVPNNKEIMAGIVAIAKIITELTKQSGQQKWTITSWFRLEAIKAKNSQHLLGRAVDFHFDGSGYTALFTKLNNTWEGGVAKGDGFIHIDCRHLYGGGKARWTY